MSVSSEKSEQATRTIRARWLIPITGDPIENGFMSIREGRIQSIGTGRVDASKIVDLGDVAIMPGLVNAHTHLEFSDLDQPVGQPGMELADWIAEAIHSRDRTADPSFAIEKGLQECAATGTALVGEIATTGSEFWTLPARSQQATTPEVIAFAETLGLSPDRGELKLGLAKTHLQRLGKGAGVSPHAPYSTPPRLIESCIELAREFKCGVAMHVAESPAERELLSQGSGPFADRLSAMGIEPARVFPWQSCGGPIENGEPILSLIRLLARAPVALLVHGNDLRREEIREVQQHANLSVAYCPRTHHFFRHPRHPVAELLAAGINVALGTDSRASNPDLNLWREVQFLLNQRQDLTPHQVITMATLGGANALRRAEDFGSLSVDRRAQMLSVPTSATNLETLYRDLAQSDAVPVDLSSDDAIHN